ncbi:MAG: UDP-3-O-(3-hydroxymyristoyl)glucosamine N-acyltransferase, partial [Thalassobaculaceae bacterium]
NSAIDRGSAGDTVIGPGTMIDNLVHISHNCVVGRGCVIAAQCGIAGSTVLGDYVVMGGQVGIAGHLTIGNGVQIAGKAMVTKGVAPGQKIGGGLPAGEVTAWRRQVATLRRLSRKFMT